jgi:hypothetical protein
MKKALWISILIVLSMTAACLIYVPYEEDGTRSRNGEETWRGDSAMDVSYFYDSLSPYGDWIDYQPYGYVWTPRRVSRSWRPYTHGRWVWTDYGWTWISSYDWGWAPFHYGRWGYDRYLGWYWVPDTIWGPAWVTWRTGDLYCGWAPLPPGAEFREGIGIGSSGYDIPQFGWVFVDGRYFLDERIDRWVLPYERNITVFNFAYIHNDIRVRAGHPYNGGVDFDRIRRMTGRDEIAMHELRDPNSPGRARVESREVLLHRPNLTPNQLARPKRIAKKDDASLALDMKDEDTAPDADLIIRDRQEHENKLLEESQETEIGSIRRKIDQDKSIAKTSEEKRKLEEDYKAKVDELKKKHAEEKAEISGRHKTETEKVKKGKIKKKD